MPIVAFAVEGLRMVENPHCAVVVLAAGRSSRMGEHKLLLPLGGRPLITYAVSAATASNARPVIVVVGYDVDAVRRALAGTGATIVVNSLYHNGMATSLHAGLAAVPAESKGVLIMLADQPLISSALLNALIAASEDSPQAIVAACYGGRRGTPVCFPRALFHELAQTSGDEGGRSVVTAHEDLLRLVEAANPEQGLDVDRKQDYERLAARWEYYARLIDA